MWGVLFLAWMLSDGLQKSDADMHALRDEVATLRQSLTEEEQLYAQDVSAQEGWELPNADTAAAQQVRPSLAEGDFQASAATPEPEKAVDGTLQKRLDGLLGTKDPVEAMFNLLSALAPFLFVFYLLMFMRRAFRD